MSESEFSPEESGPTARPNLARGGGCVAVALYVLAVVATGAVIWSLVGGYNGVVGLVAAAALGVPCIYRGVSRLIDPTLKVSFANTERERVLIDGKMSYVTRTTGHSTGTISRKGALVFIAFSGVLWAGGAALSLVPVYMKSQIDPVESCHSAKQERDWINPEHCTTACLEHRDAEACGLMARHHSSNFDNSDFDAALDFAEKACLVDAERCDRVDRYECLADPEICRGLCEDGDAQSCARLSSQYAQTYYRVPYDREMGHRFELQACLLGREQSCKYGYDSACRSGLALCDQWCREGKPVRCAWISIAFRDGKGDHLPDEEKQREYAELACAGDPTLLPGCGGL